MNGWFRRRFGFKPLAVVLALHMMPPELSDWSMAVPARAAGAQTLRLPSNCAQAGGAFLIQTICFGKDGDPRPTSTQISLIQRFENDSIKEFLQLRGLTSTQDDLSFLFANARMRMRAELRSYIQLRMANLFLKPKWLRTADEVAVTDWFTNLFFQHIIHWYQAAYNDAYHYMHNRCDWRPDPDVAKAYGLKFIPCVGVQEYNTSPGKAYFLAAAEKNEWGLIPANLLARLPQTTAPGGGSTPSGDIASTNDPLALFAATNSEMNAMVGTIGALTGAVAVVAGLSQIPAVKAKIFPTYKKHQYLSNARKVDGVQKLDGVKINASEIAKSGNLDDVNVSVRLQVASKQSAGLADDVLDAAKLAKLGSKSAASAGFGVFLAIVQYTVQLAAEAALQDKWILDDLKSAIDFMNDGLSSRDLAGYYNTETWRARMELIWLEAMFPDVPSNAPLPATVSTKTVVGAPSANARLVAANAAGTPVPVSTVTFADWDNNQYKLDYYGEAYWRILQTFQLPNGITTKSGASTAQIDGFATTIRIIDWNRDLRVVTRWGGDRFILYKAEHDETDRDCPANPLTGVTDPTDTRTCRSYVSAIVPLLDKDSNFFTLSTGAAPSFTGPTSLTFYTTNVGHKGIIRATGVPAPTLTLESGSIPFQAAATPGEGHFVCCSGSGSSFNTTAVVRATNEVGTATQTINIEIIDSSNPVRISQISAPPANATMGQFVKWVYQATGNGEMAGPVQFYTNVTLPAGLQLIDHGDGTAEISGVMTGSKLYTCPLGDCALFASTGGKFYPPDISFNNPPIWANHIPIEAVNLTMKAPPQAQLADASVTFDAGVPASFVLGTTGGTTRSIIDAPCGGLPAWATLTDNQNGTATLAGTPPRILGQLSVDIKLRVQTLGVLPLDSTCTPNFKVSVGGAPRVLSGDTATFVVGSTGAFGIVASDPAATITAGSTLPDGLRFTANGDGTASIQGVPPAGAGQERTFEYSVSGVITVRILSQTISIPYYLYDSLRIQVREAPSLTLPPVIYFMTGAPNQFGISPRGFPSLGDMQLTLQNSTLPTGVEFRYGTLLSALPGSGTLEGAPAPGAEGRSFPITFTATNSAGIATRSTVLQVLKAGDVSRDERVDCADVSIVKTALNSTPSKPNWNAAADINGDLVVNVADLAFVTSKVPSGTRCP